MKPEKQLLKEIEEEDRVPEAFFIGFYSSSDDDDDDDESGGCADEVDDEVVDKAEAVRPQHFLESEDLRGWGAGDDFLLAVDVGQESRVDKYADHQILCIYEEKVAQWKSNNPGKKVTGRVSD